MFRHIIDEDAYLAHIRPCDAVELNALIISSFDHIREWSRWLTDKNRPLENTEEWIRKNQLQYGSGNGYEMGIWYKGALAGQIGYNHFDRENRITEIGFWLGETFQRKGLITRSCTALIENAFTRLNINRIEMRCCTANLKSRKIPEKLGFKLEGIVRQAEWLHDHFEDHAVYAMLADEWPARSSCT